MNENAPKKGASEWIAGDKPTNGNYVCQTCGKVLVVPHDCRKLPECPECGNRHWYKV